MTRLRAIGLIALLGVAELGALGAAPRARADEPNPERARALFGRATQALQAGRFAEARDLLRQSLALFPMAATAFNLAVALRGTGETLEATALFERLLGGEHGALTADRRAEIAELLRATRSEIATLRVEVEGARRVDVRVDGELVGTIDDGGRLRRRVDAGRHVVLASAEGMVTIEERVSVERGRVARVALRMQPRPDAIGTLSLAAADGESDVEIVGVARAAGRLERRLVAGEYTVRVSNAHGRREQRVIVHAGRAIRWTLEPPEAALGPWPWVAIGAAVVVGATAVTVLVATGSDAEPVVDPVFGLVETLRP